MEINGTFEFEQLGDTVVLTPLLRLGEVEYERIERDGATALDWLAAAHVKNVVIDCAQTDYYGSSALGFFVRLWKRCRIQNGQMALCNASTHEREILHVTRLDTLWAICDSREEALDAVRGDHVAP